MDLVSTLKASLLAEGTNLPIGNPPSAATLRWVEECMGPGSSVKMTRPLTGGTSHINHALLVETRSGAVHRLVLRRWSSWDAEFPPEREIAALALLAGSEIVTPQLMAADPSGAYGESPALLITRLPGHPPRPAPDDLSEYLIQLAAALLSIHDLGGASTMPPYTPYNRLDVRLPPRHARNPGLWDKAFDVVSGPQPEFMPRFIHRDYHPDNTLWAYGRLTGVVDWDKASYGPIGIDIAHMRWNLLVKYGIAAADRFADAFDQVRGGYAHDPYWDLRCVVDLLPEDDHSMISEAQIPQFEGYLTELLAQLGIVSH
jgi:Ser/Thr protein kinase RdoA (MazF antagonist)